MDANPFTKIYGKVRVADTLRITGFINSNRIISKLPWLRSKC